MKVCVLQASGEGSTASYLPYDGRINLGLLLPEHEFERIPISKARAVAQVRAAEADNYVNLCDGAWDEDTPGLEVVQALERLNGLLRARIQSSTTRRVRS